MTLLKAHTGARVFKYLLLMETVWSMNIVARSSCLVCLFAVWVMHSLQFFRTLALPRCIFHGLILVAFT